MYIHISLNILTISLHSLCIHTDIRERLSKAGSLSDMRAINNNLKQLAQVQHLTVKSKLRHANMQC